MLVYCQECDETPLEYSFDDGFEHSMKRPLCVPCLSGGQEPQPPPPPPQSPPLTATEKMRGIETDHGAYGYRWWCDCGEHSRLFRFRAAMWADAWSHRQHCATAIRGN